MGADGHIVICKRADWDAANLGIEPQQLGLYTGEFLDIECCWGYFGDNLHGPNYYDGYDGPFQSNDFYLRTWCADNSYRQTTDEEQKLIRAAARWFRNHSEVHEVWT